MCWFKNIFLAFCFLAGIFTAKSQSGIALNLTFISIPEKWGIEYPTGKEIIVGQEYKNTGHFFWKNNGIIRCCEYSFCLPANMNASISHCDDSANSLHNSFLRFNCCDSFSLRKYQLKAGYSQFNPDPFTVMGDFVFTAAVHEMLIQSHNGIISIFPAVPAYWKNISFKNLRTEEAFLVSARKKEGSIDSFSIVAPEGGTAHVLLPFPTYYIYSSEKMQLLQSLINKELILKFEKGGKVEIHNGYE